MKHLIYASSSSLTDPHFGILMEEAESSYREGNEVTFAYCDGVSHYCILNPHGDRLLCTACRKYARSLIKKHLSQGIKRLPLKRKKFSTPESCPCQSVQELKNIVYKNVYIGYGILSNYTSITRDPDPDFSDPLTQKYFAFAIAHAQMLTDELIRLIEEENPDVISIFNGRLIDNRPLYDLAKFRNIPFRGNECIGGLRSNSAVGRIIYQDNLPHSIPYNTELMEKLWTMDNEPLSEKERKGRDFFERRRNGVPAGDRVYTANQKKGLLPDNWDNRKRNIVIFNSSEDELSSVGKEFEDYNLFASQYEGIKYLLEKFDSEEFHFYLRVHPNLRNVHFKYHTDLYKLPEKYKNITVIAAADPCSTYDLMDVAEKVIAFGSTMGAEAAYWKKPAILLGGAFYYLLDICYTPRTLKEAEECIKSHLEPKENYNALKYGYFVLNRHLLTIPAKYVDISARKVKLLGYEFSSSAYAKLFGSVTLGKILRLSLVVWAMWRKRIKFPNKLYYECQKSSK